MISFKISRLVKGSASAATATKYCEINSNCYAAVDFFDPDHGELDLRWYQVDAKTNKFSKKLTYVGNHKFYTTEVVKLNFQADDIGKWVIELYDQKQSIQKIQFEVIK